ncbi:hypothetical protein H072_6666 [Dactylellina haptotyla CBS 200.50]|uniref:Ubiquitin-like domain-containing protein n=1 Tax=Dactylellina haptotyla (strain CBS 200.50) TaxID=1284197 RepID=S8BVZ1_DACHA|nr:hypothetical protein H072_6666 [Dactylellina haptotyla CBS 200.50]
MGILTGTLKTIIFLENPVERPLQIFLAPTVCPIEMNDENQRVGNKQQAGPDPAVSNAKTANRSVAYRTEGEKKEKDPVTPPVEPQTMTVKVIGPNQDELSFLAKMSSKVDKLCLTYEVYKDVEAYVYRYFLDGQRLERSKTWEENGVTLVDLVDGVLTVEVMLETVGGADVPAAALETVYEVI